MSFLSSVGPMEILAFIKVVGYQRECSELAFTCTYFSCFSVVESVRITLVYHQMCLVLYNIRTRLNYRAHPYRHMYVTSQHPGFPECQASGFSGHLRKLTLHCASWCALLGATAATEGFYILTQFVLLGIFLHYHWFQHRTPEPSRQVAPLNLLTYFVSGQRFARLQDFPRALELV